MLLLKPPLPSSDRHWGVCRGNDTAFEIRFRLARAGGGWGVERTGLSVDGGLLAPGEGTRGSVILFCLLLCIFEILYHEKLII